jgi:AcrR family transcriptional regulator
MRRSGGVPKAVQTDQTTRKLLAIARAQFAARGYASTGTEHLVQAAGLTRGALYHHFGSKEGLFRAVVDDVQREVGERVEQAAARVAETHAGIWEQFVAGCRAFLAASTDPQVQRIMLVDAPAVLGWDVWRDMDSQYSLRSLKQVLAAMASEGLIVPEPIDALAHLLSGAMNEAALWIARAPDPEGALAEATASLETLLGALRVPPQRR